MYEFYAPTKILFGDGCLAEAASQLKEMNSTKVLIVTGRSKTASSQGFKDLCLGLDSSGIHYVHFGEVGADPDTAIVDKGTEVYKAQRCNAIIGFGGGSPIDCAKGIAASVAEDRPIRDFVGTGLAFTKPVPPLVAIPTTAGTGTEVTNAAVFTVVDKNGHRSKKGTSNQYYFPKLAIVDPILHISMPPSLTAATGMDALTHAIEAYVSCFSTPISDMYCLESIRLIGRSLRAACHISKGAEDEDIQSRRDMALAATLAGVALSQAGLGMVHGFAHPVGALAGLPHGLANAIILPFVMQSLIPDAAERLSDIGKALTAKDNISPEESVRAICQLGHDIGIPENLESAGVPPVYFDDILSDALSYRRRKASPRAFVDAELRELLELIYHGVPQQ
ncbi:MAG TPA: iron-containing alcohol dehydrogenase [Rectinema sp.]|nr:iron-containing alcohol dehydrogenase [Rectinema sp.]